MDIGSSQSFRISECHALRRIGKRPPGVLRSRGGARRELALRARAAYIAPVEAELGLLGAENRLGPVRNPKSDKI